jgi:hypothetical protein
MTSVVPFGQAIETARTIVDGQLRGRHAIQVMNS